MGSRIALLLSGEPDDLPASICAVQLAARSDSKLYALQDCLSGGRDWPAEPLINDNRSGESQFINSFSFVAELANTEGVQVSCHMLESKKIEQMIEFMTIHDITCLVVNKGKGHEKQLERSAWLMELQRHLVSAPRQFHSHLQVITAPPWEEMDLKQVVRQFRRLDRLVPVKIKRGGR